MKASQLHALLLLASATHTLAQDVTANGILDFIKLPLIPQAVEALVDRRNLLKHAEQFLKFGNDNGGTRAFGSKGHQATIRYIKDQLDRTGYYDVKFQAFNWTYSESKAQVYVDGKALETAALTYAPGGDVTAPLVLVSNLGCDAVGQPFRNVEDDTDLSE